MIFIVQESNAEKNWVQAMVYWPIQKESFASKHMKWQIQNVFLCFVNKLKGFKLCMILWSGFRFIESHIVHVTSATFKKSHISLYGCFFVGSDTRRIIIMIQFIKHFGIVLQFAFFQLDFLRKGKQSVSKCLTLAFCL